MIIAATGHRPSKLGGHSESSLIALAEQYLQAQAGDVTVISGMADGWDLAVADAALSLNMPLICAIPYDGHEHHLVRYRNIVNRAHEVVIVSPGEYRLWKYQKRNEWMVDHANRMLALWNGMSGGGTYNCIRYARKRHIPIDNLWQKLSG